MGARSLLARHLVLQVSASCFYKDRDRFPFCFLVGTFRTTHRMCLHVNVAYVLAAADDVHSLVDDGRVGDGPLVSDHGPRARPVLGRPDLQPHVVAGAEDHDAGGKQPDRVDVAEVTAQLPLSKWGKRVFSSTSSLFFGKVGEQGCFLNIGCLTQDPKFSN